MVLLLIIGKIIQNCWLDWNSFEVKTIIVCLRKVSITKSVSLFKVWHFYHTPVNRVEKGFPTVFRKTTKRDFDYETKKTKLRARKCLI